MNYKDGIYKHESGQVLGGHAVKIVGWGTYYSKKYWLVANSWGTSWGIDGYFKIDMSDKDSGFALGGAFNCGDLKPYVPPVDPVDPSEDCKDIASYCADYAD